MAAAWQDVVAHIQRAATNADPSAMATVLAPCAKNLARSSAFIRVVTSLVMSPVFRASRIVPGHAHMGNAGCLVRSPATDYRAPKGALNCLRADTSVPRSVTCGDEAIKSMMVDYYEALAYSDIDLNQDPCVFPPCGHVITRENLDQHMDMKEHYEYSTSDHSGHEIITGVKITSQPLSITVQKACPACRRPLRNIHRYNRIERRAWIDEATKKFIVWANSQFVPLAARVKEAEERLQEHTPMTTERDLLDRLKALSLTDLTFEGPSDVQIRKISNLTRNDRCYQDVLRLRRDIKVYLARVDEREQPFGRIYDLVRDAKRHRGVNSGLAWTPDVLQTRNRILATVALLRCEYAIMTSFLSAKKGTGIVIRVKFQAFQTACEKLIKECQSKNQPANEVEGHLFWSRFLALQRGVSDSITDGSTPLLAAREHLQTARDVCTKYPGCTSGMLAEIDDVEKMLRDSTFYAVVTNDEKAAVYAAMASDFRGTGHWYYCRNGHPFTIGECGMPMQTSRCPQCGEAVGGQSHQAMGGVTRATDLDAQFAGGG
ncbi:MAG: hypothetical protein Q9174_004509 [Haloplaca sp. 1 TL-2023]